jgi:hypothetical protein
VARGTTRVDFDTEALVDFFAGFFSGLPTAGDATNAPAGRQLIKTKGLIFISFPPLLMVHLKALAPKGFGGRAKAWPRLQPWAWRDVPVFRGRTTSRMRREYTIAAGQPPTVASIIVGQNDEMRRGCSVFCSDVAISVRRTART